MSYRKWSNEDKFKIVLEGVQGRGLSSICNDYQISQSQYYKWRDTFMSNASQVFDVASKSKKESRLEGENLKLKQTIVISDSDMKDDDMAGDSPTGQKTCSLTEPSLFSGQQLSCRLQSTTNLLARSCCDGKDYNEKLRDALRYGLYYNMFGFKTGKVIDKLFELIGDNNFILQYFTDAIEWLTGGPCLQAEITANTLKTTMPYNDGNCVKIGTMCSNYVGSCITIGGTEIWSGGCERPAEVYCCYNDLFQKAIGNAAREQLKIGWGTADGMSINAPISYGTNPCNPDKKKYKIDCRGISIEELIKLNLNHPSFTNGMQDYVNNMMSQIIGHGGMPTGKLQQYLDDSKNIAEDIKDFYK